MKTRNEIITGRKGVIAETKSILKKFPGGVREDPCKPKPLAKEAWSSG